jgi:hypothetical protein
MRPKKKIHEINAIKRRLLDDMLRIKERSSLFGVGLIKTPALYREWELCIGHRFRQLVEAAVRISIRNPMSWAEAAVLEVLQPFSDDPEVPRVFSRVYDEELLRSMTTAASALQSTTVRQGGPTRITRRQQTFVALAELWRANPKLTYKQFIDLADRSKVPIPWDNCPS